MDIDHFFHSERSNVVSLLINFQVFSKSFSNRHINITILLPSLPSQIKSDIFVTSELYYIRW